MKNKSLKRYHKLGGRILMLSLAFNIIESIYFGWNATAMSPAEEMCDTISKWGCNIGFILIILPAISLYGDYIRNLKDE